MNVVVSISVYLISHLSQRWHSVIYQVSRELETKAKDIDEMENLA